MVGVSRRLVVASSTIGLLVLNGVSANADGYEPKGRVAYERPSDWSGVYFGVHAGFAWSDSEARYSGIIPALSVTGINGQGFSGSQGSPLVGGHIGLQHQFGQLVVGVEGSFSSAFRDDFSTDLCPRQAIARFNCRSHFDDVLTVGGRLGWSMGRWLPYASGGYANAAVSHDVTNRQLNPMGTTLIRWDSGRYEGWYLGGGVDWVVSPGWTVGVDYRHYDFGSKLEDATAIIGGLWGPLPNDNATFSTTVDTIALRASWKFGRADVVSLK